jgi:16S rRNA (cytidine1402-2'-O)-methyltransferase
MTFGWGTVRCNLFFKFGGLSLSPSAKIMKMGTLYLVATPIGNLEDITLRALRILREVDLIAAEDTRHTKKLLKHYEIKTPMLSYHEQNKDKQKSRILQALEGGDVALVSDAGTPSLSDPGYELVQVSFGAGHFVRPIPGPSAPITALVASGLPTDSFLFLGYIPRRPSERNKFLQTVLHEQHTMVFFEVPHRLKHTLQEMETVFGPHRGMAICRELTKMHEEVIRGTVQELREHFGEVEPRGEFTLVVAGAKKDVRWEEEAVRKAVISRLAEGLSPSEVARQIATESKWLRQDIYRITLEEK